MLLKMPALSLRTRIVLLVCTTVLLVLAVTGLLVIWRIEARTRATLADKATRVSAFTAEAEPVVEALAGRRPRSGVQAFTDHVRVQAGVDYIVVLDMKGTRVSHPNPSLIGDRFRGGDDAAVYGGRTYTSVATGTLGSALRAFTPVWDGQGRQVGAVAVGVLMTEIDQHHWSVRRLILIGLLLGFAVGALGAVIVAGQVKRILLGMEPGEIATLLQERTASLHTVREDTLAEQLAGIQLYADALRAQTHEFMNKLHVIIGLLRLKEYERLTSYITDITRQFQGEVGHVVRAIKDPVIAGFLLARFSAAREQAIRMTLSEDARVPVLPAPSLAHEIITILGNFLENAVEAIGSAPTRDIAVSLRTEDGLLSIRVEDSGPGLPPGSLEQIFTKGYSTKGTGRGYGLYHTLRSVQASGGRLTAVNREGGGAIFTATLPFAEEESQP